MLAVRFTRSPEVSMKQLLIATLVLLPTAFVTALALAPCPYCVLSKVGL